MSWEIVVGIETHVQLLTKSKIFSGASTAFGAPPNTQASAVDIALPGVLPVLNRAAVELAVRFGLLVGGPKAINRRSIFARKNYFYPDLPKGYQISQFELPIVVGGEITIDSPTRGTIKVRLTRAHLEEDAGKSLHEDFREMTGIDLNRAGVPLIEIVSEPDLRSAQEAAAYARALHRLVTEFQICDGDMEKGSFRCDANVSVRKTGGPLGTRCEIKNINSFRFIEQAVTYEAERQIAVLEGGGRVEQETRLFDPDRNETRSMRTKEEAHDYRYFPDPDLLPLVITDADIERARADMPESLENKRKRFVQYGIPTKAAELLTTSFSNRTTLVERAADTLISQYSLPPAKQAEILSNIANTAVSSSSVALNNWGMALVQGNIDLPKEVLKIYVRVAEGRISTRQAKEVQDAVLAGEGTADDIIKKRGLEQISDADLIGKVVDEVLSANPKQIEDYRSGKDKAFNALVGQVMKLTKGKASPTQVNDILRRKLLDKWGRRDIQEAINRIEGLVGRNIFAYSSPTDSSFRSAFIDLMISLRDLMRKAEMHASRVSFTDDVIVTEQIRDVTDLIKYVRDAVCHPESDKHFLEKGNIRATFNVVFGKGKLLKIGDLEQSNPYEDDVCFFVGPQRIFLHRHILRAYEEAKKKLLPLLKTT